MNKIIPVGFVLFFLFHGCRKEMGSVEVGGYVKDKTTGAFVKDAAVVFFEDSLSIFGLSQYNQLAVVKTNAAGRYTFLFFPKNGWSYSASAYHNNYYSFHSANGKESWASVEPLRKKNIVNLYLLPEAYLRVNIKNVPPANSYDEISFRGSAGKGEVGGSFLGANVDTFQVGRVWGNNKLQLIWRIRVDGAGNYANYSDSIYCPAIDTTIYTINY